MATEIFKAIAAIIGGADLVPVNTGKSCRVLGHVFELSTRGFKQLKLAGEKFKALPHLGGHFNLPNLLAHAINFCFIENNFARHELLGANVFFDANQQFSEETRVESQGLDDNVNAVTQRLYHLIGAAALLVVCRQKPSGLRAFENVVEYLCVVVSHDSQQCALCTCGYAVIFINDFDAH